MLYRIDALQHSTVLQMQMSALTEEQRTAEESTPWHHHYPTATAGGKVTGTVLADDTTPDVTFQNTYVPGTVDLTGTKTWDDYNDIFGVRPTVDEFKAGLTVSRIGNGATTDITNDLQGTNDEEANYYAITTDQSSNVYRIYIQNVEEWAPDGTRWQYRITEDLSGMNAAEGILTARGGMTSHAAVVARGMGTCCVSGCGDLIVDVNKKTLTTKDGKVFKEGDYLSLDGSTGNVYGEEIKTVPASISGNFETFMNWADEVADLEVRTNADNPRDAKVARNFGAKGIGLCRTEHMFFDSERIFNFRKMIVAPTKEKREEALDAILPYQKDDFKELFKVMDGYEVAIRFLDPPLHEFLPHTDDEIKALAKDLDMDFVALKNKVESLKEFNPMMGHRGCRLAVTYPEIAVMQTKAVITAALEVEKEGIKVTPEIMIPLVGDVNELKYVKNIVTTTADKILADSDSSLTYKVGTMIEIPRAALLADQIAEEAEFFSFGTNDLTQMTYGFSRDDASKFLKDYYDKKIFTNDPFASLDTVGVGKLVKMAAELGRSTRSDIKLGICGEHGGDPKSIAFCQKVGLNYVSCSPFRVPVARLAAAQAKLEN